MTRDGADLIVEANGMLIQGPGTLAGELAGVRARKVFKTSSWLRYAAGELNRQEAFDAIVAVLDVPPAAVASTVNAYRDAWHIPPGLPEILDALKEHSVRLYGLVTMPATDWGHARERFAGLWSRFDGLAASGDLDAGFLSLVMTAKHP
ncbi:hypothetical protein AF335_17730 [Streptomyces eurocidicus]|uniref:FMN phosphatase YigB (HAD superfamily) n=1 Tax=Streptomyces eurocidicus TaxID=66423 RepID=A0A2N8NUJ3_STREU|nr:hypothetical protein [Streptomyces eurocidicus]MBB5120305.1 FMN phosphatase YigB (HAD superfamily) [Streptomyces eurocidicus]MBF6056019.1 hypothetical protein [Streptomyces eurocidicus]PNE32439.1 hypothetical protein AF335_17730 [Streptomyces eurocidicus]